MSKKKKKEKASKMVRTSKKPISLTCLINKKPICRMDIFRWMLLMRIHKHLCILRNNRWLHEFCQHQLDIDVLNGKHQCKLQWLNHVRVFHYPSLLHLLSQESITQNSKDETKKGKIVDWSKNQIRKKLQFHSN